MQLFWADQQFDNEIIIGQDEVIHLSKSLRKNTGDSIYCIDGSGNIFEATITKLSKNQIIAHISNTIPFVPKWKNTLHVGIALTKNIDRIEWFVEKAVEMGINQISFIKCDRSVKSNFRMDRMTRIVKSAMKQSLNTKIPVLQDLIPFDNIIKSSETLKIIPTCAGDTRKPLTKLLDLQSDTIILIGPEGDFTPEEIKLAQAAGYHTATMGETRMRTETAAMAAVAQWHGVHQIH